MILREKYLNYESSILRLDLQSLSERIKELTVRFAHIYIENNKLNEHAILRKTEHGPGVKKTTFLQNHNGIYREVYKI